MLLAVLDLTKAGAGDGRYPVLARVALAICALPCAPSRIDGQVANLERVRKFALLPLYLIRRADNDLRDAAVHRDLASYADGRAFQLFWCVIEPVPVGAPDHSREHFVGVSLREVQEGWLVLDEFCKFRRHHETAYSGVLSYVIDRVIGAVLEQPSFG